MRFRHEIVVPGDVARAVAQFASLDTGRPILNHVAVWFPETADPRDDEWAMAATDSHSFAVIANRPQREIQSLINMASRTPHHLLAPDVVNAMRRTRRTSGLLHITSPGVLHQGSWRLRAPSSMNTSKWPARASHLWDGNFTNMRPGASMASTTLSKIARFTELTDATVELVGTTGDPRTTPMVWRQMTSSAGMSAYGLAMPVRV